MRSMIEANNLGLDRLFKDFDAQHGYVIPGGKKYIATTLLEKEYIKQSKTIQTLQLTTRLSATTFKFRGNYFISFWGEVIDETEVDSELLWPLELNAGLITLLLADTRITFRENISVLEFVDAFLQQHLENDYRGYDYEDLIKFLEPISLFKIPSASVLNDADSFRTYCYVTLKATSVIKLPFSDQVLHTYLEIILDTQCRLSFENIYHSLICTSWKHCYLELYRCIERLFPLPYISDIHRELNVTSPVIEMAKILENSINWRPKEDEALQRLMDVCDESLKSEMVHIISKKTSQQTVFGGDDDILKASQTAEKYANHVYKLRNSIVHFRATNSNVQHDTEFWNSLVGLNLQIMRFLYLKFKTAISNA